MFFLQRAHIGCSLPQFLSLLSCIAGWLGLRLASELKCTAKIGFGLRKPELFLSDRIAVQLRSQPGENSSAIDLQKNYLLSQIYSLAIKTFSPSFTIMRLCCPCLLRNPVNIWRHDPVFLKTVQFNSKLPIPDFSSNF